MPRPLFWYQYVIPVQFDEGSKPVFQRWRIPILCYTEIFHIASSDQNKNDSRVRIDYGPFLLCTISMKAGACRVTLLRRWQFVETVKSICISCEVGLHYLQTLSTVLDFPVHRGYIVLLRKKFRRLIMENGEYLLTVVEPEPFTTP